MSVASWISDTPDLFTASKWDWFSRVRLYLVAEALPDGSWDWAAWAGNSACQSLHGVAGDKAGAMALAEQAAASLGSIGLPAAA